MGMLVDIRNDKHRATNNKQKKMAPDSKASHYVGHPLQTRIYIVY